MWHDNWLELASPVIPRSVRLLRALRARGVPVFSLTNFGIQSFDFAATHYDFLREFDRQFISGHLRVIKPDPRIYETVEDDERHRTRRAALHRRPRRERRHGRRDAAGRPIFSRARTAGPNGWSRPAF